MRSPGAPPTRRPAIYDEAVTDESSTGESSTGLSNTGESNTAQSNMAPSSAAPARAAVLAPGGNYGPDGPLLMFAGKAAQQRGATLHPATWDLGAEDSHAMVVARVGQVIDGLVIGGPDVIDGPAGTGSPVIFGKSLGTMAAPVAADRGLPAVWFTPLLTDADVAAALRRATAPCLLVGGTADDWWDGAVARAVTPHVLEIEGADHGMFVPGPLAVSAAVLGEVATAVERFLDDVVWRA
jgi:hypothetical protein